MAAVTSDFSGHPALGTNYTSSDLMGRAVFALNHSIGGGLTQFGERPQADGSSLAGFAVELPAGWRVLVFRGVGGAYRLVDDFVALSSGIDDELAGVQLVAGFLTYTGYSGQELLVRPVDV